MKPAELKWVNSFDLTIAVVGRKFVVPGNQIHARLKHHENRVRSLGLAMSDLLEVEQKLMSLKEKLADIKNHGQEGLQAEIYKLSIHLIHYMFSGYSRSPNTEAFCDEFKAQLNTTLSSQLPASSLPVVVHEIDTRYWSQFSNKEFDLLGQRNQIIINFLEYLSSIQINWLALIMTAIGNHTTKYPLPGSPSKYKKIEIKIVQLLQVVEQAQQDIPLLQTQIKGLEDEKEKLSKKIDPSSVQENIVIANMGLVVELKSETREGVTRLKFISIPIVTSGKRIHTIFHLFNEDHNYMGSNGVGSKIKRNHLIDSQLAAQVHKDEKFNKQLDYHSERDLYLYLQTAAFLKYFTQQLIQELSGRQLVRIHLVVLDMHSSRYLCGRCQQATVSLQQPTSSFLQYFTQHLRKAFKSDALFSEGGLRLTTRVSADIPFPLVSNKVLKERHAVPLESKAEDHVIFTMDTASVILPAMVVHPDSFKKGLHKHSVFVSSEKDGVQDVVLAYNDIVTPAKNKAAATIQHAWQFYKKKKTAAKPPDSKEKAQEKEKLSSLTS